jgi:hypothetical protein
LLCFTTTFGQTSLITITLPTTRFCPGQIFSVNYLRDASLAGHSFSVQLSNSSGLFTSGTTILGTGTTSPISSTMINVSTTSTNLYKIRVIDNTAPTNFSANSATIVINTLSSSVTTPLDTANFYIYSKTLCTGSSLKLFSNTNLHGVSGMTYEWRKASTPTVVLGTSYKYIANQADSYTVTVSKPGCVSATSPASTITFSSTITANVYYPGELHCTGSIVTLESPYNSETSTYEWKKDGVIISGITTSSYDVTTSGNYALKVTDNSCLANSNAIITFGNNLAPQINSKSDTIEICSGSSQTLISNNNYVTGNKQQWFRDGVSISSPTAYTESVTASLPGTYTIKLMEGTCSSVSNPVVVKSVTSFKPSFTKDTENTTCVNATLLRANVSTGYNGQFQWLNNGVPIAGETSSFYFTGTTSGSYTLQLTQGLCTGVSDPVNITVVSNGPSYVITSSPKLCTNGYTLSYNSTNYYTPLASFQWFKDNVAISGATNISYDVTASGSYKLSITKGTCVGFSQTLTYSLNPTGQWKPTISTVQGTTGIAKFSKCLGGVIPIYLQNSDAVLTNVQWKKDGVNIPNPSGTTNYLNAAQSGYYSAQYTAGTCTVESEPIKINIGDKQQSIKTNTWNDVSSWACGTIPIVTDEVIINKGHTISLPNNYTGFLKNLELNGTLQKGTNALLKFQMN